MIIPGRALINQQREQHAQNIRPEGKTRVQTRSVRTRAGTNVRAAPHQAQVELKRRRGGSESNIHL